MDIKTDISGHSDYFKGQMRRKFEKPSLPMAEREENNCSAVSIFISFSGAEPLAAKLIQAILLPSPDF